MSLEKFLAQESGSLASEMANGFNSAQKEGRSESPLKIICGILTKECREGLLSLSRDSGSVAVVDLGSLGFKETDMVALSIGGIFMAAIIQTIEESIIEGQIDLVSLQRRINLALSGTTLKSYSSPPNEIIMLSKEQRSKMIEAAIRDKTFSLFFERSDELIPDGLRGYLKNSLDFISSYLIPPYKKLTLVALELFKNENS